MLTIALLTTAACGRIGYDAVEPDATTGPDADGALSVTGASLTAGNRHTCAIVDGTLSCWGIGGDGRLGLGDTADRSTPSPVAEVTEWAHVVAGSRHTCAMGRDGSVWCWGGNDDGQLGVGDTASRDVPVAVATAMPARHLQTSQSHTCAILQDGSLWCWGWNLEGQLGQNDSPTVLGLQPLRVGDGNDWEDVAAGQGHTLGLRGGMLLGWGRNSGQQLGLGAGAWDQYRAPTPVHEGPFRRVSAGQCHSCAISPSNDLWCWGLNYAGQLGTGDFGALDRPTIVDASGDWMAVEVDTFHACGLRAPGTLWCWGRNAEGQLGTGDNVNTVVPTQVGTASDWVEVAVGRFHTCARRADGSVWCFGENDGQLGTGDTVRRNAPTEVRF